MSEENIQLDLPLIQPESEAPKKTRKPRVPKTPKVPKPKKEKPKKDIRSVFREKLKGITVEGIKKPWMSEKVFRLITTAEELESWAEQILADKSRHYTWADETVPVIAVDTETTSLDTRIFTDIKQLPSGEWILIYEVKTELAGVCLSADGFEGLYIPVNHEKGQNVKREDISRILQRLFDKSHLIFYNGKFDREVMRITLGINFRSYPHFEDVQVLKYINDPKADLGDLGSFTGDAGGLKSLSEHVLGIQQIEIDEVAKVRCHVWNPIKQANTLKNQVVPFTWIPPEIALWYAAADAICTWLLWYRMKDLARTRKLVHHIDHELVDSLAYIERQRFLVDVDRQRRTSRWHARKLVELKTKLGEMAAEAGWTGDLNPSSPKQLGELLFKVMGFKVYRTTDSGAASTDKETLTELVKLNPDNEFLKVFQEYRELAALHPDNLRFDPRDNSARLYLKQNVVAGGRLSGGGGDFERDGGLEWNPQGVKKLEPDDFWRVYGNVLKPDHIEEWDIEPHEESELHSSCFIEEKGVRKKAPGIINNHIGLYQDYAICLVPGCQTCGEKFGILIEDTSLDANQVVNMRCLLIAPPGWTFFSIDYCVSPETRILTSNLEWKQAKDINFGEELIGFDEHLPDKPWGRRKLRPSVVEKTKKLQLPCVKVTTDKGSVVCYEKHSWLATGSKQRGKYGWREAGDLKAGQKIAYFCAPWTQDFSYEAGYLRGIFDGEGWVGRQTLGLGQKSGVVFDTVQELLQKQGYNFVKDNNSKKNRVDVLQTNGGRKEVFKFLGSVRPERLLKNARSKMWENQDYQSKAVTPATVLSVESVGVQEVIGIRTSTHTFIAEGMLSHNCNIEVRTAANLSGEPELQNIFLQGDGDHHALTASKIFPEYNDPTSSMYKAKSLRSIAKTINFALQYGGTYQTIYRTLSKNDPTITIEKCQEMVEKYWKGVPYFKLWCEMKAARAKTAFVSETATGRVIDFHSAMETLHIHTPTKEERSRMQKYWDLKRKAKTAENPDLAEQYTAAANLLWKNPDTGVRNCQEYDKFIGYIQRVAVNCPVQGLSGDFMRIAINRIKKWVEKDPDIQRVFRFHGSVHDEIDVSIKNEYVPFILPRLTRLMKLRKYHDSQKWIVPIETDAEYGRSWDIDWNVTDKKDPAAYIHIPTLEKYVPGDWSTNIESLYKALTSGNEARFLRAKTFLQQELHPRAFACTGKLFKVTEPEEILNQLIAVIQLDEYWKIDHTPDGREYDEKLETLEQYEKRRGINARDFSCPEFGYMGAIPLEANVIRPEPNLLGEETLSASVFDAIQEKANTEAVYAS